MPLFWIIALALGGGALAYTYAKGSPARTSPSTKVWPHGLTTAEEMRGVTIALAKETDPKKLRAFATVLERYDPGSANALRNKAQQIELTQMGILAPVNPSQSRLSR